MSDGLDAPDFEWPPDAPTPGPAPAGIPQSLWDQLETIPTFDTFAGSETASRSAQQWVDVVSGTGSVSQGVNPDSGDTVTDGVVQLGVTADPASPAGASKRGVNAVADNGFGTRPRLNSVRVQNRSGTAPGGYECALVELSRRTSPTIAPVSGVEIVFDPTLGIAGYVCRCWVGGVPEDDTQVILSHDGLYHVVGFLVTSAGIIPFVDGVALDPFVPVLLQPDIACQHGFGTISTPAGGSENASLHVDWACYA